MNQKFLNLTPLRYFCPFCAEWHDWKLSHNLGYYDSPSHKAELECKKQIDNCRQRKMSIYFSEGYCYYKTIPTYSCSIGNLDIDGKISIEEIGENSKNKYVAIAVPFAVCQALDESECDDCNSKDVCLAYKARNVTNKHYVEFFFGFDFTQSDYDKIYTKTLECKEKENKEDTTMANNIFNMNTEFGPSNDKNIASTLMGVAVKSGDSWRIYDKKKNEITDIGDMQLGNLPLFIMPTTKISVGDLIKDGEEYYFVIKSATSKTLTQTVSARTGEVKNVVPIKNILGYSCYSKVIALSDSLDVCNDLDKEKLAIIAMGSQTGENSCQMEQLVPLMLFKDKLSGSDDMMDLMIISSMMSSGENDGQMNQLLPLMLLKNDGSGDDDIMKLMLISSMTGGGSMKGSNNPLMSYLLLDKFRNKKEDKLPKKTNKEDKLPQKTNKEDKPQQKANKETVE